ERRFVPGTPFTFIVENPAPRHQPAQRCYPTRMAETTTRITPDEFLKMAGQADEHLELVDGEVLRMTRPGARHGLVVAQIIKILVELIPFERARVFNDIGILLPSGNVRGPDVSVISAQRLQVHGLPSGWWPDAVDLATEVIGVEDRQVELDRKIEEYFAAGIPQVWKVNPDTRKVSVYRSSKDVRIFDENDELDAEDLFPSLRFPVRRLFE
ncbi:MAG: Uma2 family endonuclease, partial [Gammaproteobacteria bacterium]